MQHSRPGSVFLPAGRSPATNNRCRIPRRFVAIVLALLTLSGSLDSLPVNMAAASSSPAADVAGGADPAIVTTPSGAAAAAPAGGVNGLHVSGNRILNGAGQPVQLHGVNRSSFEYACSEGWGISEGPADASEVEAMKAWNINVVRVVLNESCWLGINGVTPAYGGANYQQAVANYVWLLTQHDIAVVINLHFNAPGNTLATDQQPMPDRDHAPAFWASVAARFRDNRAVLFEPYNEPYPDNEGTGTAAWSCWRDGGNCPGVPFVAAGMQELVDAIRGTGAQNIIVATGVNWGSALNHWREYRPNDPAHQLVAGWHSYGDGLSCQTAGCWDTVLAGVLQVAPILATEIGEFDCGHGYIDRVMNWLDSRGQGYLAWSWGPFDCAKDPALLRDWSGTPTQSYGQGFKDHLLSRP